MNNPSISLKSKKKKKKKDYCPKLPVHTYSELKHIYFLSIIKRQIDRELRNHQLQKYKKTRCISIYENNVDNYRITILQKDWTQWTEPQNQQKIGHKQTG